MGSRALTTEKPQHWRKQTLVSAWTFLLFPVTRRIVWESWETQEGKSQTTDDSYTSVNPLDSPWSGHIPVWDKRGGKSPANSFFPCEIPPSHPPYSEVILDMCTVSGESIHIVDYPCLPATNCSLFKILLLLCRLNWNKVEWGLLGRAPMLQHWLQEPF